MPFLYLILQKTLSIIALLFFSGCLAQRRGRESQIDIEQLLLQADPDSITRLLNEAVESSDADEQAVVSVQQSNSVEVSTSNGRRGNPRPRLFRPNALRSRLRQRPSIQINTLAPEALVATTTTERPSRSSLFSSPRRRLLFSSPVLRSALLGLPGPRSWFSSAFLFFSLASFTVHSSGNGSTSRDLKINLIIRSNELVP